MEVYHQLAVTITSPSQAAAFVDAYRKIFPYALTNAREDIDSQLEVFRRDGGCLRLEELQFDTADTFEEAYKQIFLRTAKMVPWPSFSACAAASGDLESRHYFTYSDGCLKRKYIWSENRPLQEECQKCGMKFSEPVFLEAWLNSDAAEACPCCGNPIFPEGSYRLTEETIRLDESFPFSDEDIKRALSLCRNHKPELEKDARCGCFFCQEIFSPAEIEDWDIENDNIRGTALCPRCDAPAFGYYSVIGESSGYPITAEFLRQLYDDWKWEEMQK